MRSISDHVARGYDNAVANWPLLVLAVAARVLTFMSFMILFIVGMIPAVIFGAISFSAVRAIQPAEIPTWLITNHPFLLIYALLVVGVVMIPPMLIYAFFEAGKIAALDRSDRIAGPNRGRAAFGTFDFNVWFAAARAHWWTIVMILNVVWAGALIFVLLALAAGGWAVWIAVVQPGESYALPCSLAILAALLTVVVGFISGTWGQMAMIACVREGLKTGAACRRGWALLRARPGTILGTALVMISISIAAIVALVSIQIALAFAGHVPTLGLLLLPVQLVVSVAQGVIGGLLSSWTTAAFVSIESSPQGAPVAA